VRWAADAAAAREQAAAAGAARERAEADAAAAREQAEEFFLSLPAAPETGNRDPAGEAKHLADSPVEPQTTGMTNGGLTASVPSDASPVPLPAKPVDAVLPKYYTVGAWPPDCFWEIAELVYGDPWRWPLLYEANCSKLDDPSNPDLLEPGTVLEIPSINGEYREGYFNR
jgi:nucleoid-associated protein YgaU